MADEQKKPAGDSHSHLEYATGQTKFPQDAERREHVMIDVLHYLVVVLILGMLALFLSVMLARPLE